MTGAHAGGERLVVLMFEYRHHQHLGPMAMCLGEHLVSVFVLVPLLDVRPQQMSLGTSIALAESGPMIDSALDGFRPCRTGRAGRPPRA